MYQKEVLIPPGIPVIKQVGMFQNFCPLVDMGYLDNEWYRSPLQKFWDAYLGDKKIRKEQKMEIKDKAQKIYKFPKSNIESENSF